MATQDDAQQAPLFLQILTQKLETLRQEYSSSPHDKNLAPLITDATYLFSKKIAILYSTWHREIVDHLKIGAQEIIKHVYYQSYQSFLQSLQDKHCHGHTSSFTIETHYKKCIQEVLVPGCFELPLAAKQLFDKSNIEGIIALGCLIKGETYHFDYLCKACTEGLTQVALEYQKPIGFGVLMTENLSQAAARSVLQDGENKGKEAAEALLAMLLQNFAIYLEQKKDDPY